MVSVFFGLDADAITAVDIYFNNVFHKEWLDDLIVRDMIKSIDNSVVLSNQCIQSPVLGQIPPERLSGGVKTCIMLLKMNDFVPDLIVCGPNCQSWLSKVFAIKEVVRVTMSGYDLPFDGYEIKGICENDGSVINNSKDWLIKMSDLVDCSYRNYTKKELKEYYGVES